MDDVRWHVEIVEGYPTDLAVLLNRLSRDGWQLRLVLPNGVNRWTVIVEKPR